MIVPMARVRVMGPRGRLPEVLGIVQDLGVLHLASAPTGGPLHGNALTSGEARRRRQRGRILEDVDAVLMECPTSSEAGTTGAPECPRWARLARRTRRVLARLYERAARLEEERGQLQGQEVGLDFDRVAQAIAEARPLNLEVILQHIDFELERRLVEARALEGVAEEIGEPPGVPTYGVPHRP